MDLFEAIQQRHSYRGVFADRSIPREDLEKIVQAGLLAPSGCNAQTTTFVIVDDPELLRTIGGMRSMAAMQTARAFIACVTDKAPADVYKGYSFQIEDCAAAVQNILLAVTAMGYATVWIDGWLRLADHAERIGQLLGLPEQKMVRVLLPLGVPAEKAASPAKKAFSDRVKFNHY